MVPPRDPMADAYRARRNFGMSDAANNAAGAMIYVAGHNPELHREQEEYERLQNRIGNKNPWSKGIVRGEEKYLKDKNGKDTKVPARRSILASALFKEKRRLKSRQEPLAEVLREQYDRFLYDMTDRVGKISSTKQDDKEGRLRNLTKIGNMIRKMSERTYRPQEMKKFSNIEAQALARLTGHTLRTLKFYQELWRWMRLENMIGQGNSVPGLVEKIEDVIQEQMAYVEQMTEWSAESMILKNDKKKITMLQKMDDLAIIDDDFAMKFASICDLTAEEARMQSKENRVLYESNLINL